MHTEKKRGTSLYPGVENVNKSNSYRNHHGGFLKKQEIDLLQLTSYTTPG